jgi:hypoxanthine phosphoribosyltransferase
MTKSLTVNGDTFEIMISERKIKNRIKELAAQLNRDYKGKTPVFIGILNGSFIFFADLISRSTDFSKVS